MTTSSHAGLLILEGPDGAGKTTLADAICDRVPNAIKVKLTFRPDLDIWEHHTEALRVAQDKSHDHLVIFDRHWPSEYIYGRVFRGHVQYGDWNARSMDRVIMRLCGLYVMCVPNNLHYLMGVFARKKAAGLEMFPDVYEVAVRYLDFVQGSIIRPWDGDYVEQISAYQGFAQRSDVVTYDVEKEGADMNKVIDRILRVLRNRRRR